MSAVLVVAIACSIPRSARADDDPEPIRLTYAADGGCPDERAFRAQLQARTTRARIVTEAEEARRSFDVVVRASATGYQGKLSIQSARTSVRAVEGTTCDDVVAALGLVAALAIDPRASTKPVADLATERDTAEAPASPESPAPEPPPAAAGSPAVPAAAAESPKVEPTEQAEWLLSAGVAGGARAGTMPRTTPTGLAFASLEHGGGYAPEARLGFVATTSQDVEAGAGHVAFTFYGGWLEGCPVRVGWERVGFRPCATLEAGILGASANGVTNSQSTSRTWLAAGPSGHVAWDVVRERIFVEASIEGLFPFRRDRFFFGPDLNVYRVPPASITTTLGLAVRLFP